MHVNKSAKTTPPKHKRLATGEQNFDIRCCCPSAKVLVIPVDVDARLWCDVGTQTSVDNLLAPDNVWRTRSCNLDSLASIAVNSWFALCLPFLRFGWDLDKPSGTFAELLTLVPHSTESSVPANDTVRGRIVVLSVGNCRNVISRQTCCFSCVYFCKRCQLKRVGCPHSTFKYLWKSSHNEQCERKL